MHFRDLLNELNFTRSNDSGDLIVVILAKEDDLVDKYSPLPRHQIFIPYIYATSLLKFSRVVKDCAHEMYRSGRITCVTCAIYDALSFKITSKFRRCQPVLQLHVYY